MTGLCAYRDRRCLFSLGWAVLALEAIAARHFDMIISDKTRGTNDEAGFDLLRELRVREFGIPVSVFAAYFAGSAENRRRVIRAGGFGCTNRTDMLAQRRDQTAHQRRGHLPQ